MVIPWYSIFTKWGDIVEKKEFLTFCTSVFRKNGFTRKGQTYYFDMGKDFIVVFGLMKSTYGPYYYMEYGFAIKAINKHLPYPKFNQLDINCGRIMFPKGKSLCYEEMDSEYCNSLQIVLQNHIDTLLLAGKLERAKLLYEFVLDSPSPVNYILKGTANYFGLDESIFKNQGITVVGT